MLICLLCGATFISTLIFVQSPWSDPFNKDIFNYIRRTTSKLEKRPSPLSGARREMRGLEEEVGVLKRKLASARQQYEVILRMSVIMSVTCLTSYVLFCTYVVALIFFRGSSLSECGRVAGAVTVAIALTLFISLAVAAALSPPFRKLKSKLVKEQEYARKLEDTLSSAGQASGAKPAQVTALIEALRAEVKTKGLKAETVDKARTEILEGLNRHLEKREGILNGLRSTGPSLDKPMIERAKLRAANREKRLLEQQKAPTVFSVVAWFAKGEADLKRLGGELEKLQEAIKLQDAVIQAKEQAILAKAKEKMAKEKVTFAEAKEKDLTEKLSVAERDKAMAQHLFEEEKQAASQVNPTSEVSSLVFSGPHLLQKFLALDPAKKPMYLTGFRKDGAKKDPMEPSQTKTTKATLQVLGGDDPRPDKSRSDHPSVVPSKEEGRLDGGGSQHDTTFTDPKKNKNTLTDSKKRKNAMSFDNESTGDQTMSTALPVPGDYDDPPPDKSHPEYVPSQSLMPISESRSGVEPSRSKTDPAEVRSQSLMKTKNDPDPTEPSRSKTDPAESEQNLLNTRNPDPTEPSRSKSDPAESEVSQVQSENFMSVASGDFLSPVI